MTRRINTDTPNPTGRRDLNRKMAADIPGPFANTAQCLQAARDSDKIVNILINRPREIRGVPCRGNRHKGDAIRDLMTRWIISFDEARHPWESHRRWKFDFIGEDCETRRYHSLPLLPLDRSPLR